MKAHIHSHDSPKITGPMAAYREPKPDCSNFHYQEHFLKEWLTSLLAYMKEPGFKVGETIYYDDEKYLFVGANPLIHVQKYVYIIPEGGSDNDQITVSLKRISHYHEGQQIDLGDFKYVREEMCFDCGGDGKETCDNPDHGFIDGMPGEIGRLGCPVCGHDENYKVPNGGDCETCNGAGIEWQEVKEPAKNIEYYVVLDTSSKTFGRPPVINPKWEQFQKDKKEGIILLEEIN